MKIYLFLLFIPFYSVSQKQVTCDSIATYANHRAFESAINTNRDIAKRHLDSLYFIATKNYFPKSTYYYHQDAGYYFFTAHDMGSSESHFNLALNTALKLDLPEKIIDSKIWLANHKYFQGNNIEAKSLFEDILTSSKRNSYKKGIANAFYGLSLVQVDQEKILELLIKVDSLYKDGKDLDPVLANSYKKIGSIYLQSYNNKKTAIEYFKKALEVSQETNYSYGIIEFNKLLGKIALEQGSYEEAYGYFKTLHDENVKRKDSLYVVHSLIDLARLDIETKGFDKAEERIKIAIAYYKKHLDTVSFTNASLMMVKLYLKQQNPKKAAPYFENAKQLPTRLRTAESEIKRIKLLVNHLQQSHKYKLALEKQQELDSLETVLLAQRNGKSFLDLEQKYRTHQKEQEINLLKAQNEINDKQKTNERILFVTGASILVFLCVGLYLLYRNRQITNIKLRELDVIKSNFFANISHEFRTPLTLIKGPVTEQLMEEEIGEKQRNSLLMINRNADRLLSLVDQLLELSKLESGNVTLREEAFSPGLLLKALLPSFAYAAKKKNIHFEAQIFIDDQPLWLDKEVLEKIIANLLSNAIKYTPVAGNIEFKVENTGDSLKISVKNTGEGIDKTDINKIFERFYQSKNTNEGVGIGLALVKELVSIHKGTVKVDSRKGQWTIFTVEIPVQKSSFKPNEQSFNGSELSFNRNIPASRQPNLKENIITADETQIESRILLIVEDNEDVRKLIKGLFETSFTVMEAENGAIGLQKALKSIPDLIISDVMMPVMDGVALTNALKSDERTSHIPVILLTAKAGEENHLIGLATGADDYLIKPFHAEILKVRVLKLIALREHLRQRYSQELVLKPKDITVSSTEEKFIERLQALLAEQITEPCFNAESFSQKMGMSRMQLHRKLKALVGLSTTEFIRSQRLKMAAHLLKTSDINMSEVGYAVGFNDPSYFAKCFKETFGCTPKQYEQHCSRPDIG